MRNCSDSLFCPSKLELLHRGLEPITELGETLIPIIWKHTQPATYKLNGSFRSLFLVPPLPTAQYWLFPCHSKQVGRVEWKSTRRDTHWLFWHLWRVCWLSFSPLPPLYPVLMTRRYRSVCLCLWLSVRRCCGQCWVHFVALGSSRACFLFQQRLDCIKKEVRDRLNLAAHKKNSSHIRTCKHRQVGMDVCTYTHRHACPKLRM